MCKKLLLFGSFTLYVLDGVVSLNYLYGFLIPWDILPFYSIITDLFLLSVSLLLLSSKGGFVIILLFCKYSLFAYIFLLLFKFIVLTLSDKTFGYTFVALNLYFKEISLLENIFFI